MQRPKEIRAGSTFDKIYQASEERIQRGIKDLVTTWTIIPPGKKTIGEFHELFEKNGTLRESVGQYLQDIRMHQVNKIKKFINYGNGRSDQKDVYVEGMILSTDEQRRRLNERMNGKNIPPHEKIDSQGEFYATYETKCSRESKQIINAILKRDDIIPSGQTVKTFDDLLYDDIRQRTVRTSLVNYLFSKDGTESEKRWVSVHQQMFSSFGRKKEYKHLRAGRSVDSGKKQVESQREPDTKPDIWSWAAEYVESVFGLHSARNSEAQASRMPAKRPALAGMEESNECRPLKKIRKPLRKNIYVGATMYEKVEGCCFPINAKGDPGVVASSLSDPHDKTQCAANVTFLWATFEGSRHVLNDLVPEKDRQNLPSYHEKLESNVLELLKMAKDGYLPVNRLRPEPVGKNYFLTEERNSIRENEQGTLMKGKSSQWRTVENGQVTELCGGGRAAGEAEYQALLEHSEDAKYYWIQTPVHQFDRNSTKAVIPKETFERSLQSKANRVAGDSIALNSSFERVSPRGNPNFGWQSMNTATRAEGEAFRVTSASKEWLGSPGLLDEATTWNVVRDAENPHVALVRGAQAHTSNGETPRVDLSPGRRDAFGAELARDLPYPNRLERDERHITSKIAYAHVGGTDRAGNFFIATIPTLVTSGKALQKSHDLLNKRLAEEGVPLEKRPRHPQAFLDCGTDMIDRLNELALHAAPPLESILPPRKPLRQTGLFLPVRAEKVGDARRSRRNMPPEREKDRARRVHAGRG